MVRMVKKMRAIKKKHNRDKKWAKLKRQNEYIHSEINKLKKDLVEIQQRNKYKDSYWLYLH